MCFCSEVLGGGLGQGALGAQVKLPLSPEAGLWLSLLCVFGVTLIYGIFTPWALSQVPRDGLCSHGGPGKRVASCYRK